MKNTFGRSMCVAPILWCDAPRRTNPRLRRRCSASLLGPQQSTWSTRLADHWLCISQDACAHVARFHNDVFHLDWLGRIDYVCWLDLFGFECLDCVVLIGLVGLNVLSRIGWIDLICCIDMSASVELCWFGWLDRLDWGCRFGWWDWYDCVAWLCRLCRRGWLCWMDWLCVLDWLCWFNWFDCSDLLNWVCWVDGIGWLDCLELREPSLVCELCNLHRTKQNQTEPYCANAGFAQLTGMILDWLHQIG